MRGRGTVSDTTVPPGVGQDPLSDLNTGIQKKEMEPKRNCNNTNTNKNALHFSAIQVDFDIVVLFILGWKL